MAQEIPKCPCSTCQVHNHNPSDTQVDAHIQFQVIVRAIQQVNFARPHVLRLNSGSFWRPHTQHGLVAMTTSLVLVAPSSSAFCRCFIFLLCFFLDFSLLLLQQSFCLRFLLLLSSLCLFVQFLLVLWTDRLLDIRHRPFTHHRLYSASPIILHFRIVRCKLQTTNTNYQP